MEKIKKITTFTDLVVWQEAHRLTLSIYEITKLFPKEEQYGISSEMRKAAITITSSIAEGFSRASYKEKFQFYQTGLGSLMELQNQIILSKDLLFISNNEYRAIYAQTIMVQRILYGFMKKTSTSQY